MNVHVRLFAGLRGLVGDRDVALTLPDGTTVASLRDRLADEYPMLAPLMPTLVVAVSEEVQPLDRVLRDGELVDLIPPISGG
jgi:sulfur-carrier protein